MAPAILEKAQLILDKSLNIIEASSDFCSLYNTTNSWLINKPLEDIFCSKDRKGAKEFHGQLSSYNGGVIDSIIMLELEDVQYLTRLKLDQEDSGWIAEFENILLNPDNIVFQLNIGKERWTNIIKNSKEGILILDSENCLHEFNSAFVELMQFKNDHGVLINEEGLSGRNLFKLLNSPEFDELEASIVKAHKRKTARYSEVHQYQDRFLRMEMRPVHVPVKGFIGSCIVIFDITAQHQLELAHQEINQKNKDIQSMLKNLPQGIFTVSDGREIHHEHSAYLCQILDQEDIAGTDIMETVFSSSSLNNDEKSQIEASIDAIINSESMVFDFNQHLLVTEFTKSVDGQNKILEVDWNPITDSEDTVEKIMVTLRDVTELRELQRISEANKQEMTIISQVLKLSQKKFVSFGESARKFINENRQLIEAASTINDVDIEQLFRNMHTIKGNARTYQFSLITESSHQAEETYSVLRQQIDSSISKEQLLEDLDAVAKSVEEYRVVNDEVLGRKGRQNRNYSDRGAFVQTSDIQDLRSMLDTQPQTLEEANKLISGLQDRLSVIDKVSLERIFSSQKDALETIAGKLNKPVPQLDIECKGAMIQQDQVETLDNILTHLVSNSVDHGIEIPEKRLKQGKTEQGRLSLKVTNMQEARLSISISDDGQGMATKKMYELAIENGNIDSTEPLSPLVIHDIVLKPGISTKAEVSEFSGRGVGMDAVRKFLHDINGELELHFLEDLTADQEYTRFEWLLHIPC